MAELKGAKRAKVSQKGPTQVRAGVGKFLDLKKAAVRWVLPGAVTLQFLSNMSIFQGCELHFLSNVSIFQGCDVAFFIKCVYFSGLWRCIFYQSV